MKIEMLEYVKSCNPNAPIPASLMTMGELAELLQSRNDLEEGMRLMVTMSNDEEIRNDNTWLGVGEIPNTTDNVTVQSNPVLNGSVRYPDNKPIIDAICEAYEAQFMDGCGNDADLYNFARGR